MNRYFSFILLLLVSCNSGNETCNTSSTELELLIRAYQDREGYDKAQYPLGLHTRAYYKSEAEFAQGELQYFACINPDELTETEQISYQLLQFVLQEKIDFYTYEMFLNPLLSDSGFHIDLNYIVRSISSYEEAKDYLNKLNAIPEFVNQGLTNIEEGLKKGVSQPRVIFKGYESTYNKHIVEDFKDSFFYSPFKNLPEQLTKKQKDSVLNAAELAIKTKVTPQFRRIKSFFETIYFPQTRTSTGISQTPNGEALYQNRINYYTTSTNYTAEDIHQIGLREVERIKAEMEQIISDLQFEGTFDDFFHFLRTDKQFYAQTPAELLRIARDIAKRADAQLPVFFKTLPRKPYGVEAVPEAIAPKYTTGRYIGTSKNSTKPGYYWVNTYNLPSRTLYTMPH
jgi:uncharacterized protein (DUF885 family)